MTARIIVDEDAVGDDEWFIDIESLEHVGSRRGSARLWWRSFDDTQNRMGQPETGEACLASHERCE